MTTPPRRGNNPATRLKGRAKTLPFPFCTWSIQLAAGWRSGVTQASHRALLVNREPLFNVPPVVVAVLAVLVLIHVVRIFILSEQQDIEFLLTFAFIPARYDSSVVLGGALPGEGADVWTFVTYALLHADWTHLAVNTVWLLPFGTAVARRFGAQRFLAFFAVTAAAGAALHLATHAGEEPLSYEHGFPLRLVAPGRRGFEWVKWITRVEVLTAPDPGQVLGIFTSSFTDAGRGG